MAQKKKISRTRIVISLIILIPVLLLLFQFTSGNLLSFVIVSNSMYPTLFVEDHVLVKVSNHYIPRRGDLIAFKNPEDKNTFLAKRVIGIQGDLVSTKKGHLFLNGQRERIFEADKIKIRVEDHEFKVEEKSVFVLGDNRNLSFDSLDFGTISYDDILGRVLFIYWPLNRMKKVR